MAIYSKPEILPEPEMINWERFKAMRDVQCEMGEYFAVQDKMRKGIELSRAEQKFYERIVSHMDITTNERTLWRMVTPYEGFEQEIRTGHYKFKGLTSTSGSYSDFFDFWSGDKFNVATKSATEGYMLQITVPKGKKLLDCNAIAKNFIGKAFHTRMRSEVILPEGIARVTGVDNALNIIKMQLL